MINDFELCNFPTESAEIEGCLSSTQRQFMLSIVEKHYHQIE